MNKKELIITDLMELEICDSSGLDHIKKIVRKTWRESWSQDTLRHVSRQGIRFALRGTDLVSLAILNEGCYQPGQALYLFNTARRLGADIFLDIGANIGYYSLLATKTNDFTEIHAIEAHPYIYHKLLMQIEENAFQNIITPYNFVPSESSRKLYIDREATAMACVSAYERDDIISVIAVKLDSIFNFVGRNIAIKLDLEGHQVEALTGMTNLLSHNKVLLQVRVVNNFGERVGRDNMEAAVYLQDNKFKCITTMVADYYFSNYEE